jgi:hypothetical protein
VKSFQNDGSMVFAVPKRIKAACSPQNYEFGGFETFVTQDDRGAGSLVKGPE